MKGCDIVVEYGSVFEFNGYDGDNDGEESVGEYAECRGWEFSIGR